MWKEISGSGLGTTHFQKWGKGEENHSSGRHEWTQRSESSGGRIPGSLDKMGSPEEEAGMAMEALCHFGSSSCWGLSIDNLSSPKNLHKCSMRDEPMCKLCGKKTELWHTSTVRMQYPRIYRWQHDSVLPVLAGTPEHANSWASHHL